MDWALALVVAGTSLLLLWLPPASGSDATPASVVLLLVASLPLAVRRRHPSPPS